MEAPVSERGHVAPVCTLALAITLALGGLLVAPDSPSSPAPAQHALHSP
jgi:hypothetical protein